MKPFEDSPDLVQVPSLPQEADAAKGSVLLSFKKLRGGLLMLLGYLLSPLCWWNDLVFNLPIAYGFGYLCHLLSEDFFLPGAIAGYWLSNLLGIVLIQFGAVDMLQHQAKERNFKKELLTGVLTSTLYTLVIVAIVQLKLVDISAFLPDPQALNLSALLPLTQAGR